MEQLPLVLRLLSAKMNTADLKVFKGGLSCANIKKTER